MLTTFYVFRVFLTEGDQPATAGTAGTAGKPKPKLKHFITASTPVEAFGKWSALASVQGLPATGWRVTMSAHGTARDPATDD